MVRLDNLVAGRTNSISLRLNESGDNHKYLVLELQSLSNLVATAQCQASAGAAPRFARPLFILKKILGEMKNRPEQESQNYIDIS